MREIIVQNTLTGKKEKLETLEANHVKIYACGVTVYDDCHIGHAMQAVYFDVIRRYLEYAGYRVTYVRNYTDVDDKIIQRAAERRITPMELVEQTIASSERDMKALGVRPANFEPRVSQFIPEIIAMIDELIQKGFAYRNASGDVYFRVARKADYGKLSNRKIDELKSGTREIQKSEKEDELDFALWKADQTVGASWASPFGQGRPGWHIECSAMSKTHLGPSFDIHGGGRDLVFPHHENEIAQSEAANGCSYARYWMHSGLLTINKQKMSKSLGNSILIRDFVERFPGEVLRLAYLQYHYSSNVDFSETTFRQAARRLLYFYETLEQLDRIAAEFSKDAAFLPKHLPLELRELFHREMQNDFNSVGALREMHLAFRKANELKAAKKSESKSASARSYALVLREVAQVFGLLAMEPRAFIRQLKLQILKEMSLDEATILARIKERQLAREAKDWAKADAVRIELSQLGIELMDSPDGTDWTVQWKEEDGKHATDTPV